MEDINVKIIKGTVVKIEGFPFQLTSSLNLKVSDSILKVDSHKLVHSLDEATNEKLHRNKCSL